MYENNVVKFVAVLNRKHSVPRLLNAFGHATAGLCSKLTVPEQHFLTYTNECAGFASAISEYPFIILEAKNSAQLNTLRASAAEKKIPHNIFVDAMIGASAAEQLDATQRQPAEQIDFMTIVLFGTAADLDPITKKFSVLKDRVTASVGDAGLPHP